MLLIVASSPDEASVNIRDRILELGGWSSMADFDGSPAWRRGDHRLVTLRGMHLHVDDVDALAREAFGESPDVVVYVSKHRAESGRNSLTVHPIGNWKAAEFGGREGEVVPAATGRMSDTLRRVAALAASSGYPVTLEATHHGPFLRAPTYYVEVGTGPEAWSDPRPASILARAVLDAGDPGYPVAVGVGGGHYVPRITDVALRRRISFGHLVPSHALEPPDPRVLDRAIDGTPEASLAYFHRKAIPKPALRELVRFFRDRGLEPVRESDLDSIPGLPENL